jgi:hypothetical protein
LGKKRVALSAERKKLNTALKGTESNITKTIQLGLKKPIKSAKNKGYVLGAGKGLQKRGSADVRYV